MGSLRWAIKESATFHTKSHEATQRTRYAAGTMLKMTNWAGSQKLRQEATLITLNIRAPTTQGNNPTIGKTRGSRLTQQRERCALHGGT